MLTRLRDAWLVLIGKSAAIPMPEPKLYQDGYVVARNAASFQIGGACWWYLKPEETE